MARSTIVQVSFNSGELSPYMDARVDQSRYMSGCRTLRNMLPAPHGAAFRRPGLRFMGLTEEETADAERPVRLIPFVFNEEQAYVLEFSHRRMRVWRKGGLVVDAFDEPFVLETPYEAKHLWSLQYCRSADMLYLASPWYPPHRLERRGHTAWEINPMSFGPKGAAPASIAASSVGGAEREYFYIVTAIMEDTDEESLPSKAALCMGGKSLSVSVYNSVWWSAVEGAREYRVYRGGGGAGNYGLLGRAKGCSFTDRGQEADFSQGPPEYRNPFEGEGNYPSCVQFSQQRLCFAGSLNNPQTLWAGRVGNYQNFNISHPLQADDAVTVTIAADRVNSIRWLMAQKALLVGTVDAEWAVGGNNGEPLNPSSCSVNRQSSRGSSTVPPIAVGDSILYVQRGGNVVREFRYCLDTDGFNGIDLSVLSEHILRDRRIVDWAWQESPFSVLWCVLDNGKMAGLTLVREHEIVAWHTHDTEGAFEAVAVIPGPGGDELWAVVRRDLPAGGFVRCVERMDPPFEGETAHQAFFVDSGLTWDGAPVTELSGLDHLEGRAVQILADGCTHPQQTVRQGRIHLERPSSVVHVGLGFQSDIAPMASEPAAAQGQALGMVRRVGRVRFRVYKTLGCLVGPDAETLREVLFRKVVHPLGEGPPLYSGDLSVLIDAKVGVRGGIFLRQEEPLPFTLLSTAHEVEVGEV